MIFKTCLRPLMTCLEGDLDVDQRLSSFRKITNEAVSKTSKVSVM